MTSSYLWVGVALCHAVEPLKIVVGVGEMSRAAGKIVTAGDRTIDERLGVFTQLSIALFGLFLLGRVGQIGLKTLYRRIAIEDALSYEESLRGYQGYQVCALLTGRNLWSCFDSYRALQCGLINALLGILAGAASIARESIPIALLGLLIVALATGLMVGCLYLHRSYCDEVDALNRVAEVQRGDLEKRSRRQKGITREKALLRLTHARLVRLSLIINAIWRGSGVVAYGTAASLIYLVGRTLIRLGRYVELAAYEGAIISPIWDVCNATFAISTHLEHHYKTHQALALLRDFPIESPLRSSLRGYCPCRREEEMRIRAEYLIPSRGSADLVPLFDCSAEGVPIPLGVTLLSGKEGSGKSTFAKLFSDLLDRSHLYIDGVDPTALAEVTLAMDQHTNVPERPVPARDYFGMDRIDRAMGIAAELHSLMSDQRCLERLMTEGGAMPIHGEKTGGLSGGQAKLIAFIKVLTEIDSSTTLLVLDEPDTGVSAESAVALYHYVEAHCARHQAGGAHGMAWPRRVIYISHHSEIMALSTRTIHF